MPKIEVPWNLDRTLYAIAEYCDAPIYRVEDLTNWSYLIEADGDVSVVAADDSIYTPMQTVFANKMTAKTVAHALNEELKDKIKKGGRR